MFCCKQSCNFYTFFYPQYTYILRKVHLNIKLFFILLTFFQIFFCKSKKWECKCCDEKKPQMNKLKKTAYCKDVKLFNKKANTTEQKTESSK